MAKRSVIGSVVKNRTPGKADYISIREDVTLRKGENLMLESAKGQLESITAAVAAGKISEDLGEKIKERISKIPDFVRFEIVRINKE